MHFIGFPRVPPEVMTPRARAYLLATALYCLGMGMSLLLLPDRFNAASYALVRSMPWGLNGWGVTHLAVGLIALSAPWRGRPLLAYGALMGATAMVGPWGVGLTIAFFTQPKASPAGAITYSFITAIHLIQVRAPLRSPFDPVLRHEAEPDE